MDWTIVVSVLVALLLWPVVLALVAALIFVPAATILRGRFRGLMGHRMARCREMFSSRQPEAAASPAGADACPCAPATESGGQ